MRLTIAIPTVNRDYCVGRAVESALAQTSPAVDILVSNNGSTDRTREILEAYTDPRLRVFHHAPTMPVAAHANFIMTEVQGELVVALSDDDFLEPEFAERVLDLFARHPELSFAYTRCWTHVRDAALPSPSGPEVEEALTFFQNYFAGERHVFWCACVTRSDAIRRLCPVPLDVQIGDMYFWTQLAFDGPIGCVPELLAHYTYLVDNVSLGIPVCAWARETYTITSRIAERYRESAEDPLAIANLKKAMGRYLARTTANQFALNAAKGASKTSLLRALRLCGGLLAADLTMAIPRVAASLALPAPLVKKLVLAFASSRSRWARPGGTAATSGLRRHT
jgi:glycosyltransferase involved in cell wall biosynthesis